MHDLVWVRSIAATEGGKMALCHVQATHDGIVILRSPPCKIANAGQARQHGGYSTLSLMQLFWAHLWHFVHCVLWVLQ